MAALLAVFVHVVRTHVAPLEAHRVQHEAHHMYGDLALQLTQAHNWRHSSSSPSSFNRTPPCHLVSQCRHVALFLIAVVSTTAAAFGAALAETLQQGQVVHSDKSLHATAEG
jgi:hypothetical protein